MSLIGTVNAYACASLALLAAALLLAVLRRLDAGSRRPFRQRHVLHIGYALCTSALLLPLLATAWPARHALLPAPVQIWSGASMHAVASGATRDARIAVAAAPAVLSLPLDTAATVLTIVIAMGTLVLLARIGRDLDYAHRFMASATPFRIRGSARVLISDVADVPFSLWTPGRSFVVIPENLLVRPADLRLALRHEAQHHRQGDTRLVYVLQVVRALFWWHPGARSLVRHLFELQEFACDEAVTSRGDTSPQAYCLCLLRAAEEARNVCSPVGLGITGTTSGALLRRVQAVLQRPHVHRSGYVAALAAAAAIVSLGALASASPVRDRRLSLEDARELARTAGEPGAFPLTVNESVLTELNRLLGTPDGLDWLRNSLTRMLVHQPHIEAQLEHHGLPRELLAVPLVESGYRNQQGGIGAGLWMFIAPTARRFGLSVGPDRDERLDIALETDAAMRLLARLHEQFQDWPLAVLAYNIGSGQVEQGMRTSGSRDAWTVGATHREGASYLPRVMAAALVLSHPGLLDGQRNR